MSDNEHRLLAEALHDVQGKVAISSYHCQLMDDLYGDWNYIESAPKKAHSTNTRSDNVKQDRVEVLWVNYEIPKQEIIEWQNQQKSLLPLFGEQI
jgi:DNA adenine methylase